MKRAGNQTNADPNSNERVSDKAEKKKKGNQLAGQSIDESGKLKCQSSSKQEDQPEYLKQKIRTLEEELDITKEDGMRNKKVVQLLQKFISDLRQEDEMSDVRYEAPTNIEKTYGDDILDEISSRMKDLRQRILIKSNDWKTEKAALENKLKDRNESIILLNEKNENLDRDLKEMQRVNVELQHQVQIEKDKYQTQYRELQRTETCIDNLKRELQKTKNEKEELIVRKTSENWKAEEKNLQQKIKQREQNIKERDKCIKALNDENEKLNKTLAKKESLLEDKEQVNRELFQKQTQLQEEMQVNNEKNQKAVQERDQHIQYQYLKLQQKNIEVNNLTKALQESEKERNDLTLRLSKLAAACLTKDNPNIADLSDTNRPTKIAERYSELYDNEWKDAYEEFLVKKNMEEVQCVQSLVDLLKATYDACVQLTKPNREMLKTLTSVFITLNCDLTHTKQSAGIHDHSFALSTSPDTASKMDENIKDNGRSIAEEKTKDRVATIPKGFTTNVDTGKVSSEVVIDVKFSDEEMKTISDMRRLSAIQFETKKNISKLIAEKIAFERGIETKKMVKVMAFIAKCAELCWYMAIQEPPVVIEFHEPVDDELFEKDKYKAYKEMGEKLDYVVWPPLFLHSGVGRLCKGTAQGKK